MVNIRIRTLIFYGLQYPFSLFFFKTISEQGYRLNHVRISQKSIYSRSLISTS